MIRDPRSRLRLLCVLAFAAAAVSCTTLQPQPENMSLHFLTLPAQPRPALAVREVVIEVAPPRAWPGFDTPQMAYVRRPYELEYFAMSRWVDTPSRMLAPLLVRALEQSGRFRTVVQAPSGVAATYRLDVEIARLLQDFSTRPSRIEVVLRVQITDVATKRVIATRMFEDIEEAPSENPAGGVAAANAALRRVLERLADFCAESTLR